MVSRQWARIFLNYSLCNKGRRAESSLSVWSGGSVLRLCSPRFREVSHSAIPQKGLQFSSCALNYKIPIKLIKSFILLLQMGLQWESSNMKLRWHERGHGQSPSLSQDWMWRWLLSEQKPKSIFFPHNCNYSHRTLRSLETSVCVIAITHKASKECSRSNFKLH